MRSFACVCGNAIYFENDRCLSCGRSLGFLPDLLTLSAFDELTADAPALDPQALGRTYSPCRNYIENQTCNWMLPSGSSDKYCLSCGLNAVIPDLSAPRRIQLWYEVEKAKRRLLYSLLSLGLPVEGKRERADGLAFRILADERLDQDRATAIIDEPVTTGHYAGFVTINLMEADRRMREEMRAAMNESYRTVLGHFRHESGHYYWARLVGPTADLARFRKRFGDESHDYAQSLKAYYDNGPAPEWRENYITAYASSHPLEDFADTWAHYLHIVDTLETANDSQLTIGGRKLGAPAISDSIQTEPSNAATNHFDETLEDWVVLTRTMNLLNRSMGLEDAYPLALAPNVIEKLRFVHHLVQARARRSS